MLSASLLVLAFAALQTPSLTVLVQDGLGVPGVGLVTSIDNLAVNSFGTWLVEADTDQPNGDLDSVLLKSGTLLLQEGQALSAPAGAMLDSFDSMTLNSNGDSGWNFFLSGTTGTSDDSGLYFGALLVLQEGTISTAPQFSPGTPYIGFFETKFNDANQILVMASVDDPLIPTSVDRALVVLQLGPGGALQSETVLFKEGDILPGQVNLVVDFGTGPHEFAFNDSGSVAYFADLDGATTTDGCFYMDGSRLAQEGSPSPVAGRNWELLSSRPIHLNNSGDYVFRGNLDGDTATDEVLVKNGAVLIQEGDSLPDIGPWTLTGFGTSAPLWISDKGDVLWFGDWDDPNTSQDTGLFFNDRLLVQEGVTTVGGQLLMSLSGVQDGFAMSPSGRFILFEGTLQGGMDAAILATLPLNLTPPQPGLAGQVNLLEACYAIPGALVYFAGSGTLGASAFNCGGSTLVSGLQSPLLLGTATADASGTASLSRFVAAGLSGATVHLQALLGGSCELSEVLSYSFP